MAVGGTGVFVGVRVGVGGIGVLVGVGTGVFVGGIGVGVSVGTGVFVGIGVGVSEGGGAVGAGVDVDASCATVPCQNSSTSANRAMIATIRIALRDIRVALALIKSDRRNSSALGSRDAKTRHALMACSDFSMEVKQGRSIQHLRDFAMP